MRQLWLLLTPRRLQTLNVLHHAGRREIFRYVFFLIAGCLTASAVLWISTKGFFALHAAGPVGDLLAGQLVEILHHFFFLALVISGVIFGISVFYLSEDLNLLLALPVAPRAFFASRILQCVLAAAGVAWVVGLLVLVPFGASRGGGALFYALLPVGFAAFLFIPTAIGMGLAVAAVSIFPARRLRDALVFFAVLFAAALYLGVRYLKPEQLLYPQHFKQLEHYTAFLAHSRLAWLPSQWAAAWWAQLADGKMAWYLPTALLAMLLVAMVGLWQVLKYFYFDGWNKAQEIARRPRLAVRSSFWLFARMPQPWRSLFLKDLRLFSRDRLRMSQAVMVAAVMAIYLFNFRILKLTEMPFPRAQTDAAFFWLNLLLSGMVLSALAVRFVYPMLSLEGRNWWFLRSLPVSMTQVVMGKIVLALPPMLGIGLVLAACANAMVGLPVVLQIAAVPVVMLIAVAMTLAAMGFGAVFLQPKAENISRITTSFGAIAFMSACFLWLLALIGILSTADWWVRLRGIALPGRAGLLLIAGCGAAIAALALAAAATVPWGIRALERRHD